MKKIFQLLAALLLPLAAASCATERVQATHVAGVPVTPAVLSALTQEVPSPAVPTDPNAVLPVDPEITTGKLDNGLRYFIRRNGVPADRAEIWLAVNAGSVLEDEDQRGL